MSRWIAVAVLTVVSAGALVGAGARAAIVLEVAVLPLALGLLVGTGIASIERFAPYEGIGSVAEPREDRPHASMAGRVRAAARSRHDVHTQLLPVLRPLITEVCADNGVDAEDHDAVAGLLGPDLADLVLRRRDRRHDRDTAGVPVADIARMVDRLERHP